MAALAADPDSHADSRAQARDAAVRDARHAAPGLIAALGPAARTTFGLAGIPDAASRLLKSCH